MKAKKESRKGATADSPNGVGKEGVEARKHAGADAAAQSRSHGKQSRPASSGWMAYVLAAAGALVAAFLVYGPSLHGAFQFDDTTLPFTIDIGAPFRVWVTSLRPILMGSYWMNSKISGDDPSSYHLVNILIHWVASCLVFLIVRRLLEGAAVPKSRLTLIAGFTAAIFLLHPVQTEAVAYVAGRSECLSDMFLFAAFAVFLYRRQAAVSWATVAGVLALFGAAALSKEHTVALVGLLLLTDFWWNPGFSFQGIRRNWALYLPILVGAVAVAYYFRELITNATTAGFGMKDLTWYQYFFTECRALFVYPFQFLLPVNLTADWYFPISKSLLDHGAIFGLIALLALCVLAWHFRKRFPLACYGFFVYLVLMSPTSSILPIKDPVAERRLYLSILGLLLIVAEVLNRTRFDRKQLITGCSVVVLLCAIATYIRAGVWADPVALWTDTVSKSPNNRRAHFQLAYAQWQAQRPDIAVAEFQKTAQIGPVTSDLLLDWGLAFDSLHQTDQAIAKLRESVAMEPTAEAYVNIAKVYAENAQWQEALAALDSAQKINPNNVTIYAYRGKIHLKNNRICEAIAEYRHTLQIDPRFEDTRHDLAIAQQMPHPGCR
jgi:tetratricopeptide (TPR) repeat protein